MRMKRMILPLLVLLATLSLLLAGCSGLGYMIEEYNSRFGIHDDSVLLPGDMGYDEKDMLRDSYETMKSNDFNVVAPYAPDARYRWSILNDNDNSEVDCLTESVRTQRNLHLYIKESGLSEDAYKLKLELTVGDKTYVDVAILLVQKDVVTSQ